MGELWLRFGCQKISVEHLDVKEEDFEGGLMSFVYAEKTDNSNGINIYSDTKLTLDETNRLNWGDKQYRLIEKFGIIISIIIHPSICISFAGNNIKYMYNLLDRLSYMGEFEYDQLINLAQEIHYSAPENAIEFIICYVDDETISHIVCIKNKQVERDCINAWIGSYDAFRQLQALRVNGIQNTSMLYYFDKVVSDCNDNSVGGFPICTAYLNSERRFIYQGALFTCNDRIQTYTPGENIKLYVSAQEGGYTVTYYESHDEVIIELNQINRIIYYTARYRIQENNSKQQENLKYFLLPLLLESETNRVVDS